MPLLRVHDCACAFAIVLIAAGVVGCSAEASRVIQFPDFAHPGPAPIQRARAVQHDPYPLSDLGPEVVGGRPREYQQPLPEIDRARLGPQRPTLQPLPPPGAAVTAPPVVSSPFPVTPAQPGVPLNTTPPPIVTSTTAPVAAPPPTSQPSAFPRRPGY